MHQNLKDALEDFKKNKLPPPPELKCPHCGKPMSIGPVRVNFSSFNTDGSLDARFEVAYPCPEKNKEYYVTRAYYTRYPDRGWHPTGGGGSCYIATAAYGTPLHHDLDILRNFRDKHLPSCLIDLYCKSSPPIADFIKDKDWLRFLCRQPIRLIVKLYGRVV